MDEEYLSLKVAHNELRLTELSDELSQIQGTLKQGERIDHIRYQVATIAEQMTMFEYRLRVLERQTGLSVWLLKQAITIAVLITIGWILGVVHF
jgi:TolA-binding protein